MKARLIFHKKQRLSDNSIIEMAIWQLPGADEERPHGLKYRLYYGRDGQRLIGYDNERGKGDHKHVGNEESPYSFVSARQLVADFLADVRRMRGEQHDE